MHDSSQSPRAWSTCTTTTTNIMDSAQSTHFTCKQLTIVKNAYSSNSKVVWIFVHLSHSASSIGILDNSETQPYLHRQYVHVWLIERRHVQPKQKWFLKQSFTWPTTPTWYGVLDNLELSAICCCNLRTQYVHAWLNFGCKFSQMKSGVSSNCPLDPSCFLHSGVFENYELGPICTPNRRIPDQREGCTLI